MSDLRACPFCGGSATLFRNYNYRSNVWFVFAKCEVCGAQGKSVPVRTDLDLEDETWWESYDCKKAEVFWNTRTEK